MNDVNQRRLRYFHEVLTLGSIRAAADRINTAPSVITRQIRLLEEEVGSVLFERAPHGMLPTEAAHHLLEYWRGCQTQKQHLEDQLNQMRGLERGHVRLAIGEGFVDSLMDDVLGAFSDRYPKIEVVVSVVSVSDVVAEVIDDIAHVGLAYNPPVAADAHCRVSASHPVKLLVGASHPLARRKGPVSLDQILAHPLALMSKDYGLGQLIQAVAYAEKLRIAPALTANSLVVLKRFLRAGKGVTFAPEFAAVRELASGELVARPIHHPMFQAAQAKLLVRAGRPLSPAADALRKWMLSRMTAFSRAIPA
ncbi:LysR family transcriptional regulator [Cupriavidus pauculus]|uniref:LysR family transcriptional regulator n=1 Tax=Cupriavidus pauculus TaxID=82633 RepID=A0A5P2HAA1_9BURK|nr:LysR family transcriptional regulator [Cupriavidus pauculus]QET05012.1 LysR family transcriptional regulator [Cupriavidus pauculus]